MPRLEKQENLFAHYSEERSQREAPLAARMRPGSFPTAQLHGTCLCLPKCA